MKFSLVFFNFYVLVSSSAYVLLENDDPKESIIWPSEYSFTAEEINLVDSFIEPFEVWYSGENNRSRKDYYGGTNKLYYVTDTDAQVVYEYSIHPITTEEVRNKDICKKTILEDATTQPNFLPDIEDYKFLHEEQQDGNQVRVWTKKNEDEKTRTVTKLTLFVHRTVYGFDVPLKEVAIATSADRGLISGHTITNFKQFSFIIDPADVMFEDEDCNQNLNEYSDFKSLIEHLHPHNPTHVDKAFHSYKKHHSKTYKQSEHELRKEIFYRNWRRVHEHNSKNLSYKMELNGFADRTEEELEYLSGTMPTDPSVVGSMPFPYTDEELMELAKELPKSYDMRLQGILGPVKHQGYTCGSCWAFATTVTIEGAFSKHFGGRNLDLSEQSLIDCSWGFENLGCDGGWPVRAYEYIMKHGIPLDSDYGEYTQKDGYCTLNNTTETFNIRGFAKVTLMSPIALKVALVKYGPVAVIIQTTDTFFYYSSGVYYDIKCKGRRLDHAVAVVGYGERDGTPYWILQNSYGENWGQDGYMLMSALNNNCFVLDAPFYPII